MADHEASSSAPVQHHPLENVALNGDEEITLEMPPPSSVPPPLPPTAAARASHVPKNAPTEHTKAQSKHNWVKFDDDDGTGGSGGLDDDDGGINEIAVGSNNIGSGNIIDDGGNNIGRNSSVNSENPIRSVATTAATGVAASTAANRLSPILPPPPPSSQSNNTRPRTPNESQPQQQTLSSSNSNSAADVAPAVLTTESTHVDLNASGRTQQQQSQHQQQQHQIKPKTSQISPPVTAASNSQHQHHVQLPQSSSATTASSAAVAAAAAMPTIPMQQYQQQQQQRLHNHNNGTTTTATTNSAIQKTSNITIPMESQPPMRTIELSTGRIREGFANGDVIVTLLPANTKWPWITPAIFRPELVPEELMAQGLTLTVEEYVNAMETLVNDYRFTVYNICYKRILVCWILFAFVVLLALLFSGLQGIALFSLGVAWLFLNAAAIFLCMWMKLRLARGLEKCLARVNKQLMRHKILLILDDRGRISCHKVNLCFMYFDSTQCVNFLNEFLEHTEQSGGEAIKAGWEAKLDIDVNDIVIQGNNPVRLSRKQERGMQLFLRYGSRWGMEALRGLVDVTPLEPGRHCGQFQCPCQYIKEHLQCKPRGKLKCLNFIYWVLASERYDY